MKILVVASTFPGSSDDATPGFVKDQAIALKECCPEPDITV